MKLDTTFGCEGCKRRKEALKKLLKKARERWLKTVRPRTGKKK